MAGSKRKRRSAPGSRFAEKEAESSAEGRTPRLPRSVSRPRDGGVRRDLIAAALELMTTSGSGGLSLREIARKAGVSSAAPYRHFANKEELLAAVAEQGFRTLAQRVAENTDGDGDQGLREFESIAIAYVEFAAENPVHFRVMFGPEIQDIDRHPALRDVRDTTAGLFREGVAKVLEGPGGDGFLLDVDDFTLTVWSLVHGLAALVVDDHIRDLGRPAQEPGDLVRAVTGMIQSLAARRGDDTKS